MNDRTITVIAGKMDGPKGATAPPVLQFRWQLDPSTDVGLVLVAATRRLKGAGVDTPKLDSEVLLAYVLGCTRRVCTRIRSGYFRNRSANVSNKWWSVVSCGSR